MVAMSCDRYVGVVPEGFSSTSRRLDLQAKMRALLFTTVCAVGLAALVSLLVYAAIVASRDNLHSVVARELYRSAQPSVDDINRYRRTLGIRTIINLRGENAGTDWYDDEVRAARAQGVQHVDFRMSARRGLTNAEAWQLIALMRSMPKPILIHCESGADRSGLAASLYLAAVKSTDERTAEDQLSIRYGHINAPFGKGYGMNRTFEAMEPSLGYTGS